MPVTFIIAQTVNTERAIELKLANCMIVWEYVSVFVPKALYIAEIGVRSLIFTIRRK
jgi:hypothetical protein